MKLTVEELIEHGINYQGCDMFKVGDVLFTEAELREDMLFIIRLQNEKIDHLEVNDFTENYKHDNKKLQETIDELNIKLDRYLHQLNRSVSRKDYNEMLTKKNEDCGSCDLLNESIKDQMEIIEELDTEVVYQKAVITKLIEVKS